MTKVLRQVAISMVAIGLLVLADSPPAWAQAAMNQTTINAAATATAGTVSVASATSIVAGHEMFIEREAMLVQSVSGTTISVQRGYDGTNAASHPQGALAYTGTPSRFSRTNYAGSCTSTSQVVLPIVNTATGQLFDCVNSLWASFTTTPGGAGGNIRSRRDVGNAATTIALTDYVVSLRTTGTGSGGTGNPVITWTLPTVGTGILGKEYVFLDESGGVTATTYIAVYGTVNGSTSYLIKTAYGSVTVLAGSGGWFVLNCSRSGVPAAGTSGQCYQP